jgi:hypothetical protein
MEIISTSDEEAEAAKFKKSEWIEHGRAYKESDLPLCVKAAKAKMLAVPAEILKQAIPHNHLSVNCLLKTSLPDQSAELVHLQPRLLFRKEEANVSLKTILARPIPATETLQALEDALGQAWFDGSQSFVDWRYNEGADFFPFWVLSLWRMMESIRKRKREWELGKTYLLREEAKAGVEAKRTIFAAVLDALDVLGWNSTLPFLRGDVTTHLLVAFLGQHWMAETHMNAMLKDLRD